MIILCFFVLFSTAVINCDDIKTVDQCTATDVLPFSYSLVGKNGPPHWGEIFEDCATGKSQSPIDLTTDNNGTTRSVSYQYVGYDIPMFGDIHNTGANLEVYPTDGVERYIVYEGENCDLDHIDFHFGAGSSDGTTHSIDSKKYMMEVHITNKCKERFAVFSIMFSESSSDNARIQNLTEAPQLVQFAGDKKPLEKPISLMAAMPQSCFGDNGVRGDQEYFVYRGSYTFPPCRENVTWFVPQTFTDISQNQMKFFRDLRATSKDSKDQCYLYPNIRPLQQQNSRDITLVDASCKDDSKNK